MHTTAEAKPKFKLVPVDQLMKMGHICAWHDCSKTFKGDMPTGWTWLQIYWSQVVSVDPLQRDWMRDAVLCPHHTLQIDKLFKKLHRHAE